MSSYSYFCFFLNLISTPPFSSTHCTCNTPTTVVFFSLTSLYPFNHIHFLNQKMSNEEEEILVQYLMMTRTIELKLIDVDNVQLFATLLLCKVLKFKFNPIFRAREAGAKRLWDNYFAPNPVYPPFIFRRHFHMN